MPEEERTPGTSTHGAGIVRAPGKVFWIGEYAVLDGAPAVVAAVDRAAEVRWEPAPDGTPGVVVFASGGQEHVLWDERGVLQTSALPPSLGLVAAAAETLNEAGILPSAGQLAADSSELVEGEKLGLGSSGAVAAGVVAALTPTALGVSTRLDLALRAHARFQGGAGSGADVIASCLGGLVEVQAGQPPRAVSLPVGLQWAAIAIGQPADTRQLIEAYRRWRAADPAAEPSVERLTGASLAAIQCLRAGDVAGWLRAVRVYAEFERQMTLAGVPIVTEAVAGAIGAAESVGWVAKPSGAGGGDIVVAFADRTGDRAELEAACRRAGVAVVPVSIEPRGAL